MLLKNKKRTKVLFFLFLFCSFFALAFSFTNTASAYTSEDMPEGYRLISQDDVGKTFGVDLENVIYFDTSYVIPSSVPVSVLVGFTGYDSPSYQNSIYYSGNIDLYFVNVSGSSPDSTVKTIYKSMSDVWVYDSFDFADYPNAVSYPFTLEYLSDDASFIYVKDIVNLTLIESILVLFSNLVIWIPSVLTGLILMFYSAETGLTFLGALACAGLGISVIFLLISIVSNFLHFRG